MMFCRSFALPMAGEDEFGGERVEVGAAKEEGSYGVHGRVEVVGNFGGISGRICTYFPRRVFWKSLVPCGALGLRVRPAGK